MAEPQVPAGAVLAHTMWGEPKGDVAVFLGLAAGTVEPAASYAAYEDTPVFDRGRDSLPAPEAVAVVSTLPPPTTDMVSGDEPWWPEDLDPPETPAALVPEDRSKRCRAKDDTCRGWRIAGSDFCAAHSGILKGGDHERTGRGKKKRRYTPVAQRKAPT